MSRVTPEEVREVIETEIGDDGLAVFIASAHQIVESRPEGCDMDEAQLKVLELWLAAHLVASRERQLASTKLGDASDSFMGQSGLGLDSTLYGQNVRLFDRCGFLATLGKRAASFKVL